MVWLLCIAGLVLSAISFSGTWFVAGAAVLAHFLNSDGSPGWWLVGAMFAVSALVEVAEAWSGSWGVKRRGGSNLAGFAALIGGLIGMVLGAFIPVPVMGSIIGMLIGSFVPAYVVEVIRLKHRGKAAEIAFGAVVARILVIVLKVAVTLGMIAVLIFDAIIH